MSRSALILGLFALVGGGVVAAIYHTTKPRIDASERAYMLRSLHAVIPPKEHNNDLFHDMIQVRDPELLGSDTPLPVFRARYDGKPVALAIMTVAPDGYNGAIRLLVGIRVDGVLSGVRVVSQHETPGLGDAIEANHSDWILGFDGRSLHNPEPKGWHVQRDGGVFDQFTGATITPRAVVKAVYNALKFYAKNKDWLFTRPSLGKPAAHGEVAQSEKEGSTDE